MVALKPGEMQLHSEHSLAMPMAIWGTQNLVAKVAVNKLTPSFNYRAPNTH